MRPTIVIHVWYTSRVYSHVPLFSNLPADHHLLWKKNPQLRCGIRFSIIKLFFPFPFSSSLFYFVYQVSLLSFLLTNFFSTRTPLHFFFFFHNSTLYLEKIFSLTKRREEKETRREERKKLSLKNQRNFPLYIFFFHRKKIFSQIFTIKLLSFFFWGHFLSYIWHLPQLQCGVAGVESWSNNTQEFFNLYLSHLPSD